MTKEEALEKSIQKWESISEGIGIDTCSENCALCKLYNIENGCHGCPVFIESGSFYCRATPYQDWREHQGKHYQNRPKGAKYMVLCPVCKLLAQEELKYLKSLRRQK